MKSSPKFWAAVLTQSTPPAQAESDLFAVALASERPRRCRFWIGTDSPKLKFRPASQADGDFPNDRDTSRNPGEPRIFDMLIARARKPGAICRSPPIRIGDRHRLRPRRSHEKDAPWHTITGQSDWGRSWLTSC